VQYCPLCAVLNKKCAVLKFEINFNFVLDVLKQRSRWNIEIENSKMPLQQNEQRHKQRLAKYMRMPSSSNNSNIQYFQKSRCTSFLHKREEPGNEVVICIASANYYNRLWLIWIWKGLLFWGHPVCCHYVLSRLIDLGLLNVVLYKSITIKRWRHWWHLLWSVQYWHFLRIGPGPLNHLYDNESKLYVDIHSATQAVNRLHTTCSFRQKLIV
jgi:hypothetical protein